LWNCLALPLAGQDGTRRTKRINDIKDLKDFPISQCQFAGRGVVSPAVSFTF
jgi:hypothetical protein